MPDYCPHVCPVCGGCDVCCGGCMRPGEGIVYGVPEADPAAREVGEAFAAAMNAAASTRAEAHRELARRRAARPHRGGHEHR